MVDLTVREVNTTSEPRLESEDNLLEVRDLQMHFPIRQGFLAKNAGVVRALLTSRMARHSDWWGKAAVARPLLDVVLCGHMMSLAVTCTTVSAMAKYVILRF